MHILISGDRYGLGEWANSKIDPVTKKIVKEKNISHRGLEAYFRNIGCSVNNISSYYATNLDSYNAIRAAFPIPFERDPDTGEIRYTQWLYFNGRKVQRHLLDGGTKPIYFKYTDKEEFMKDWLNEELDDLFWWNKSVPRIDTIDWDAEPRMTIWFQSETNEPLDEIYSKLNSIYMPIHCIGGGGKLDLNLMKNYKYLIPVVESLHDFLSDDIVNNFTKNSEPSRVGFRKLFDYIVANFMPKS